MQAVDIVIAYLRRLQLCVCVCVCVCCVLTSSQSDKENVEKTHTQKHNMRAGQAIRIQYAAHPNPDRDAVLEHSEPNQLHYDTRSLRVWFKF